MKGMQRTVIKGVPNHCYQNTIGGFLLFYTISDYLVYFTLFCLAAVKCGIRVITLCLMPDHVHFTAIAEESKNLSDLAYHTHRQYAVEFNELCGTHGSLFNSPFGSAPKIGDKKVRSNIIYVYNNPSERHLVTQAEQYRWNFLPYIKSNHPFSEPILLRFASSSLRRCLKTVDSFHNNGKHLNHTVLKRMFDSLDKRESEQLTDYVICKYSIIEHEEAIRYFGDYDKMITAVHSTTGSEYDIQESFTGQRDDCYARLTNILIKKEGFKDIHDILSLKDEDKAILYSRLIGKTTATTRQLKKYLHMRDSK